MNRAKKAILTFTAYAKSKGYTEKVVGDDSYTKTRRVGSPLIKLWGAKDGKLQITENGRKIEVPYE